MNSQKGSTLLEVLITLVIVSIGLLSMATLQIQSIKLNRAALEKIQAVSLANEIADTLFINSAQADNGDYDLAINDQVNRAPNQTVARVNIDEWLARVQSLPGGRLAIGAPTAMASASNIQTFDIVICWRDTLAIVDATTIATCGNNQSMFTFRASSRT